MSKTFYITTTLPYVNAEAHMGHALEFVRADVIARVKKLQGYDVFFNTGTDEHGQKIFTAAERAGQDVQTYVDFYADKFKALLPLLGISSDIHFIRTTDHYHEAAAQEFWRRVEKNGYIYKKNYKSKYCVGCELEKTDSELENGKCPIHQNIEIETIEEENYFFKFSLFGDKLLALYENGEHRIVPSFRVNEVREFIKRGLEDFSISRLKSKMQWGIPVPGDNEHVMYVWFDALVNYISTLGWPSEDGNFKKYWVEGTPTQYCGKDNIRFQSVMWQAMLLAAGINPSHTVVVDGFVTGDGGVKMSKSLGNVINPVDVVSEYGTDALRYFLLRELSPFEDSPFTMERFKLAYNANLANGIGNLTSRIMKMAETNSIKIEIRTSYNLTGLESDMYQKAVDDFDLKSAMDYIWVRIGYLDKWIHNKQPFKTIKNDFETGKAEIIFLLEELNMIANLLLPFLPETADDIIKCIAMNKSPESPIFLRK